MKSGHTRSQPVLCLFACLLACVVLAVLLAALAVALRLLINFRVPLHFFFLRSNPLLLDAKPLRPFTLYRHLIHPLCSL